MADRCCLQRVEFRKNLRSWIFKTSTEGRNFQRMNILDFVKPLLPAVVASSGSKSSTNEALGFFEPLWRTVVASRRGPSARFGCKNNGPGPKRGRTQAGPGPKPGPDPSRARTQAGPRPKPDPDPSQARTQTGPKPKPDPEPRGPCTWGMGGGLAMDTRKSV